MFIVVHVGGGGVHIGANTRAAVLLLPRYGWAAADTHVGSGHWAACWAG